MSILVKQGRFRGRQNVLKSVYFVGQLTSFLTCFDVDIGQLFDLKMPNADLIFYRVRSLLFGDFHIHRALKHSHRLDKLSDKFKTNTFLEMENT